MIQPKTDKNMVFTENDHEEDEAFDNANEKDFSTDRASDIQTNLSSLPKRKNSLGSNHGWFLSTDTVGGLHKLKEEGRAPIGYFDSYGNYFPSTLESDEIMPEHLTHYNLMGTLYSNLISLFSDRCDEVFVAADLLWYPILGNPKARISPDIMVIFGLPQFETGSYFQHQNSSIVPQVVFEILSEGNNKLEIRRKRKLYEYLGVEEYYEIDQLGVTPDIKIWIRNEKDEFVLQESWINFASPLLGITFKLHKGVRIECDDKRQKVELDIEEIVCYYSNGVPFTKITESINKIKETAIALEKSRKESQEKDFKLQKAEQTIQDKDSEIQEKDSKIQENEKALEEKDNVIKRLQDELAKSKNTQSQNP